MNPKLNWKLPLFLTLLLCLSSHSPLGRTNSAPVALTGFRGTEWYDSTKGMPELFRSPEVLEFWDTHAVVDPSTKTPEHRVFDISAPSSDFTKETPGMQKYSSVRPSGIPGVVVGNGRSGYSGPIPNTGNFDDDLKSYLSLLRKYAPK